MKRKTVVTICIILAFAMGLAIAIPAIWGGFLATQVSAKTANELQQELNESQKNRSQLNSDLSQTKKEQQTALEKKAVLDREIAGLESDITTIDSEIEKKEDEILTKETEIKQLENDIEETDELLKKRLRVMYEKGSAGYLEIIFSASSFSELLVRVDMVQQLLNHDQTLITQLTDRKQGVESAKKEIEAQQREKEEMRTMLATQKQQVETKRAEGQKLIDELGEKTEELEAALKQEEEDGNRILSELTQKQKEQAAAAQQNNSSGGGEAPAYGGGKLGWPCALRGTVTSEFGWRTFRGVRNNHTGIDIAVPMGTAVFAAEDGVITTSGWDNSYGNYITINHGSLATLYAHNSRLLVSVGQHVNKGDKIALSGSTGNSTGPHVHFGVIVGGRYVNPRPYIF